MQEFSGADFLPWLIGLSALFGLLWGSFLNVCIFRVVRDISVVTPRSFCTRCEAPIAPYDNIPVVSYLLLKGRCRHCHAPIGIQYPIVEVVTSVSLALVIWSYGPTLLAIKWAIFESLMIALFWTDLDVQILPDEFTWTGASIGIGFAFLTPLHSVIADVLLARWGERVRSISDALLGGALVPLGLWAFAVVYKRLRKLEADPLGLGDIKLMILIGVFFGFEHAIPVFVWGTIAGAVFGGIYVVIKGKAGWKTEIPFGTFLCGAGAISGLVKTLST